MNQNAILFNFCFGFALKVFQVGEPSLLRTISLPSGPLYFEIYEVNG